MKIPRMVPGLSIFALSLALGCAAPAAAQPKAAHPPGWITDSKSGCKVWNPAPQVHETIRWSGACKDGYASGEGTLQWYENGRAGDRYVGEYHDGKRNGHGVVTMSNGTRIEGDWRDDELLQPGVNEI